MLNFRSSSALLAIAVSSYFVSPALADGIILQPRTTLGYQYYEFDIAGSQFDAFNVDFPIFGVGLTAQHGKFFLDLYAQTNLVTGEDADDQLNSAGVDDGLNLESEIDRQEINLTAGYAITSNITAFAGVKYAHNDIETTFTDDDPVIDALIAGNFLDIDVEYLGPFGGGALALPIASLGALSLSGSVAYLYGDAVINAENAAGVVITDNLNIDGQALGYNVGLTWSGNLSPLDSSLANLGYSLGVDYSAYEFEDDDSEEYDEQTVRAKVDLKYRF